MLVALVLYGVATIGCATAQSIEGLIAARFVQALGGAGSIVLARAVVRDLYSGVRAGPRIVADGIDHGIRADRRADDRRRVADRVRLARDFYLAGRSSPRCPARSRRCCCRRRCAQRAPGPFSFAAMGGLYRSVLVHRGFLANLGILTTSFIGLFAWVSGAPIVMQGARYGLSPLVFGVTFAMGAAGYMLGTYHRVAHRDAARPRPHHGHRLLWRWRPAA